MDLEAFSFCADAGRRMSPQICVSCSDNGFRVAGLPAGRDSLDRVEPFLVMGGLVDYLQGMYGLDTSQLKLEELKPGQSIAIPVTGLS
jgi:hypothetical protein